MKEGDLKQVRFFGALLAIQITQVSNNLIKTEFRAKIPQTHSFPVGAEQITTALAEVQLLEDLSLSFTGVWSLKTEDFPLLSVGYRNIPENRFSPKELDQFFGPMWEIKVFPVPREWKGEITHLLRSEGLPHVAEWLKTKDRIPHHTGRMACSVSFNLETKTLEFTVQDELGRS